MKNDEEMNKIIESAFNECGADITKTLDAFNDDVILKLDGVADRTKSIKKMMILTGLTAILYAVFYVLSV